MASSVHSSPLIESLTAFFWKGRMDTAATDPTFDGTHGKIPAQALGYRGLTRAVYLNFRPLAIVEVLMDDLHQMQAHRCSVRHHRCSYLAAASKISEAVFGRLALRLLPPNYSSCSAPTIHYSSKQMLQGNSTPAYSAASISRSFSAQSSTFQIHPYMAAGASNSKESSPWLKIDDSRTRNQDVFSCDRVLASITRAVVTHVRRLKRLDMFQERAAIGLPPPRISTTRRDSPAGRRQRSSTAASGQ